MIQVERTSIGDGRLRNIKEHDPGKWHGIPGETIHSADLWPVSSVGSKLSGQILSYTEEPLEEVRERDRQKWYGIKGTWKK